MEIAMTALSYITARTTVASDNTNLPTVRLVSALGLAATGLFFALGFAPAISLALAAG
jgi:hypothetical protein